MIRKIKYNYVWWAIIILSILPVILWWMSPTTVNRYNHWINIIFSLGQLAGLVGMALFSFSLILSARFRFFDKYFKGLNNVYAKHSLIGQIAFILLLLHPLLLVFQHGGSIAGAVYFFSLSSDTPKNAGIISLAILILLIILTLYLRPKYNIWKLTHKFMGLSFYFASVHVFLIPSDVARYAPLRFYMLGLAVLALLIFAYKILFGKFLIKKYKYTVESVTALNGHIWEISLKPKNQQLQFKAGQFMFISFLDNKIGQESHPFSISSGINEPNLKITVKALGDYTNKLANLSVGSVAEIEGPFGFFSYQNSVYHNQIWIAGGIGITPFLSMVKSLKTNDDYNIDLFYCFRNNNESVHLDLLQSLEPKLKVHLFCYDVDGYLDIDKIKNISGPLVEKDIFICSPPAMIESFKKQFIGQGVDKKLIHSEEFNF